MGEEESGQAAADLSDDPPGDGGGSPAHSGTDGGFLRGAVPGE